MPGDIAITRAIHVGKCTGPQKGLHFITTVDYGSRAQHWLMSRLVWSLGSSRIQHESLEKQALARDALSLVAQANDTVGYFVAPGQPLSAFFARDAEHIGNFVRLQAATIT